MKIVCIGDSLTAGYGVEQEESWISLLNQWGKNEYINKGISGDTTSGMLARFQRDVIDLSPQYVLIMGGLNDYIAGGTGEGVKVNYMAMAHHAAHHRITPVIGIAPDLIPEAAPPLWAQFTDFHQVLKKHIAFREWTFSFCKAFGLPSMDFWPLAQKSSHLSPEQRFIDGLHLSPESHMILASMALETIEGIEIPIP
ncbi:MAG: GDSL-type esterase/lipase family protein [Anaerovoracaceae bacterium]|jgi:acyl-CoA thioesterase-1